MKQIQSGDESFKLNLKVYNINNQLEVPASITYSLYCVTTETAIITDSVLTPNSEITISLIGDSVTLLGNNNKELRRVCVTSIDNDSYSMTRTFEYEVIPATTCS